MNPYSVLHAFDKQELGSYWFRTASPAYLLELLQESDYDMLTFLDGIETSLSSFTDYQADANNPLPLIYQSGYLTIKDYDPEFLLYRLGFPNDEAKHGFLNYLLPYYSSVNESAQNLHISRLVQDLCAGDADAFLNRIKVFFSDFPYELNEKNECHYQLVLCLVLKLMGQFMQVEVRTTACNITALVETPQRIYLLKFTLNGTAKLVLQDIMKDEICLIPYREDGREGIRVVIHQRKHYNIVNIIVFHRLYPVLSYLCDTKKGDYE